MSMEKRPVVILRSYATGGTTKHVLSPAQYQRGTKELTAMRSFIHLRRIQDDTGCQILRGVYFEFAEGMTLNHFRMDTN